jgi:autotransporter-associated beta strand protein
MKKSIPSFASQLTRPQSLRGASVKTLSLRAVRSLPEIAFRGSAAALALLALCGFNPQSLAATISKTSTAGALNAGASWTGGTAPGSGDVAQFGSAITGAQADTLTNSAGGAVAIGELQFLSPGGAITIGGDTVLSTLTLNGVANSSGLNIGIDMSADTNAVTIGSAFDNLAIGAAQSWLVSSGNTLTISGTVSGTANVAIGNGTAADNGTVNLSAGTATYTGNYIVNDATLSVNTTQASGAGFILINGTTSTAQTNSVAADYGLNQITSNFGGTLLGNGHMILGAGYTTSYANSAQYQGFGGVVTYNTGDEQKGYNFNNSPYATFDFGTLGTILHDRGAGNFVIGAVENGSAAAILGGQASGAGTINYIIGSANTSTAFNGSLGGASGGAQGEITKVGIGTLILTGTTVSTGYGGLNFDGGTLQLNYQSNPTGVMGTTNALGFGGGALTLLAKNSGATTQTLGNVTLTGGAGGDLIVNPNGGTSTTLTLGTLTATAAGGSLNIQPTATMGGSALSYGTGTVAITTTTNKSTDGTYGARITYGSDWATTASTGSPYTLSAYSGYTTFVGSAGSATTDYVLNDNGTMTASESFNSLKLTNDTTGQSLSVGSGNTLTLTNGGLLFAGSNPYTITGGTLKSNTTTNSDLVIQNLGTGGLTINSVIANGAGASTLTVAGGGTLTLGGANTYTGSTYLSGGTTIVTAENNFGVPAAASVIALNGGTLEANASFTLAGGSTGGIQIGGGGGTFNVTSGKTLTVSSVISNQAANIFGPLIKTGAGTLVLNGASTYDGATIISNGILSVSSLPSEGATGAGSATSGIGESESVAPALILDGGTLQYTGAAVSTDRVFTVDQNGGTINANGTGGLTFNNPLAGAYTGAGNRTLTLQGSSVATNTLTGPIIDANSEQITGDSGITSVTVAGSTWALAGLNTYSGNTTVSAGTLALNNSQSNNSISNSPVITVASGGTLSASGLYNGTLVLGGAQTLTGAGPVTGTVATSSGTVLNPGTITGGDAGTGTLTLGNLTLNTGSITNFGLSTANLDGALGGTANLINVGVLNLAGTSTLQFYVPNSATGFVPGSSGQTFDLFQYTSLTGTPSSSLTVGSTANSAYTYTFGTSTAGGHDYVTVTITQTGVAGTWITNGAGNWSSGSNWSGGVPQNAGDTATFGSAITAPATITLDTNESIAQATFSNSNSYSIAGTNTLTLDGKGNGASLVVTNGSHTVSVPVALNDTTTLAVSAGNALTLSGVIANETTAESVIVNGAGTVYLSNANTYGPAAGTVGTTIAAGTVNVGTNTSLSTGDVSITGNSTLQSGAAGLNLANNVAIGAGNTLTVDDQGNTFTLSGLISGATGGLTKIGSGTVILPSADTYAGSTTISNGTLQLGNGGMAGSVGGSITDNGTLALDRSDNYSFGNTISGSGGLTQIGTDNVTLTTANAFGGNTSIYGGSLIISNINALQNSTLNYNSFGGSLTFGTVTSATFGGLEGNQNLALSNASSAAVALTVGGNSQNTTYSGNLTGIGSLTTAGNGTLTLSGANTYTGTTTIGDIGLNITGSLGTSGAYSGAISMNAGTLNLNGATVYAASLSNNGNVINVYNSANVTLSGGLYLNTNNGVAGGVIDITSGTVTANSAQDGRDGLNYGTTFQTAGSTVDGFYVNGGTLNITTTLNLGGNTTSNQSSASFRQDSGSTTVGGITTITDDNGGRLSLLDLSGGAFTDGDTSGTGILVGGVWPSVYAELLVRGTGVLTTPKITLGNSSQTTGDDQFYAIGGTTYIGSGGIVNGGATGTITGVQFGLASSTVAPIIGGTSNWSSSVGFTLANDSAGASPIIQAANSSGTAENIVLSGTLSGTGGLTKTGAGTLTLTGANSYAGITTINAGTLNINGEYALGGSVYSGLTFNGGTLQYANPFPGTNGLTDVTENSTAAAEPVLISSGGATIDTNGSNVTFRHTLGGGGSGGLTVADTAGTGSLTLDAAATYTGATIINSGATLKLGDGTSGHDGTIASSSGVTDNGTLIYNRYGANSTSLAINGTGNVTVSGPGSQKLATSSGYTGTTTVAAGGTLIVSGGLTGTTTVNDNGTLEADANINSATTINVGTGATLSGNGGTVGPVSDVGGTIAPGDTIGSTGPGVLTANGNVTLDANSTFSIRLGVVSETDGDQLLLSSGAITLGGANLVVNTGASVNDPTLADVGDLYTIVNGGYNTGTSGFFAGLGASGDSFTTSGGYTFDVYYGVSNSNVGVSGNSVDVELVAIPEPGTWASLLGGFGMLLVWQRSRRRRA